MSEPAGLADWDGSTLPLAERMLAALRDTGIGQAEAVAAVAAVLPLFVADLHELANEVEWKYRSMSFQRGNGCPSQTRLHPSGKTIRARAAVLDSMVQSGPSQA